MRENTTRKFHIVLVETNGGFAAAYEPELAAPKLQPHRQPGGIRRSLYFERKGLWMQTDVQCTAGKLIFASAFVPMLSHVLCLKRCLCTCVRVRLAQVSTQNPPFRFSPTRTFVIQRPLEGVPKAETASSVNRNQICPVSKSSSWDSGQLYVPI